MAFDIVDRSNWSKAELEIYEKELDVARCRQNALDTAEEKGLRKGKLETAKKMLAKGMPIDVVCEVTGLSVDEIKKI